MDSSSTFGYSQKIIVEDLEKIIKKLIFSNNQLVSVISMSGEIDYLEKTPEKYKKRDSNTTPPSEISGN
ncbi:hypothetical protein [Nostoc sp. TCL26-01]|uniref:hypothetical protein n=1 Tax=Nostoc sp. TCL26-01 TaxID=2576904 RepID=UPI0015BD2190|nr:hypothetical protein [Nostoc sp. TCL26-01]